MWKITHTDIDNVAYGEHHPDDVEFNFNLDGVHSMSHIMDMSHHLATMQYSEPYATDFILSHEGMDVMAGMITGARKNLEGTGLDVAGLSWEHYYDERRRFPYALLDLETSSYVAVQEDIFIIVEEILTAVENQDRGLGITFDNGTSGILRNFRIEPADSTSILSHIKSLAEQKPGFDFEITTDKEWKMYAPQKVTISDFAAEQGKNVIDMGFDSSGIKGNNVLGLGAGSSRKITSVKSNTASYAKYRRHDVIIEFGDIIDQSQVDSLTTAELARALVADLGLWVEITPSAVVEVFESVTLGDSILVKGNTGFMQINDYYRLTSMEGGINKQGEGNLTLRFDDVSV